MAHEFEAALIIGLAIIAVGILIFTADVSFDPYGSDGGGSRYRDQVGYDLITEDAGRAILVGTVQSLDARVETLGTFDVRTTAERVVVAKKIFNGVFFGDDSLKISGNVRDLELDVFNTNSYGNLIVTANDGAQKRVVVDKRLGIGRYTIPVENDGTLEIRAESSGWRIWAPTVYSVKAATDVVTKKTWRDDFVLEPNVTRIDLRLFFTGYGGKLRVRVNDRIVLEREVYGDEVISMERSELEDINKIELDAWDNSAFRGRIDIVKYTKTEDFGRFELDFYMNDSYMEMLNKRPGKITFDVVKITNPGQMIVKIRNSQGNVVYTRHLDVSQQSYLEYFTRNHATPGVNTLIIEAVDSTFWVKDVRIWLVDP